jgi:diamine N-acetyltransferase
MSLCGEHVLLQPATMADRRAVWEWIAHSDLTASMTGPLEFTEAPVPSWEGFCADYLPHFFGGSRPKVGRNFIIEPIVASPSQFRGVGHISYSRMDELPAGAELDIWMRDSTCCGHGWGSNALRILSRHLHEAFGGRELILRPSARNIRAVRAYEKAEFKRLPLSNDEQAAIYGPGEYRDTTVMRRHLDAIHREHAK